MRSRYRSFIFSKRQIISLMYSKCTFYIFNVFQMYILYLKSIPNVYFTSLMYSKCIFYFLKVFQMYISYLESIPNVYLYLFVYFCIFIYIFVYFFENFLNAFFIIFVYFCTFLSIFFSQNKVNLNREPPGWSDYCGRGNLA